MIRTYSDLVNLRTYDERLAYLKLDSAVGVATFGYDRYLNQAFYNSCEWDEVRTKVLIRDNVCDLGIEGYDIFKFPLIHHMNAITPEQILDRDPDILNPEFLITVSRKTHRYLHYGLDKPELFADRKPNDTILWRP